VVGEGVEGRGKSNVTTTGNKIEADKSVGSTLATANLPNDEQQTHKLTVPGAADNIGHVLQALNIC
jgi:hypothetical protein